ncbi:hypothetical protein [Paenarthrobacter ilicis]|uniref:Uncharacterized protein n=1 Tax=Paenarthrobacter ilicis TaxID=43665 RepID=A0ABX0TCX9_9MICC|nr:hypothetical protein [Paenarthrobacter ilicis]MBM7794194.1 hypothetical protein [Paenarthrobacter ilicis]NIJ00374.1 hypothetical protein [Paenarthrobacter ilicis]
MTAATATGRGAFQSLIMVASGAVTAIVPAAVQGVAARLFALDDQAHIALFLSFGSFIAGVLAAGLLEPRMADTSLMEKTYIPLWATALGVAGTLGMVIFPGSVAAMAVGLPCAMLALQIGRMHAAFTAGWRMEALTASALVLGAGGALVLAGQKSPWAVSVLGLAMIVAILIRAIKAPYKASGRPRLAPTAWITLETAMVALVPLGIVATVYLLQRNDEAVALKATITVLGALQPILGYMRTRLLGAHSRSLVLGMSGLSVLAIAAILLLEVLGVFNALFGTAWNVVTMSALSLACLWKLITIPSTLPFTYLRRAGLVGQVFWIRVASSLLYLAVSVALLTVSDSLALLFLGLAVVETVTGLLLFAKYRSVAKAHQILEPSPA